MIAVSYTYLCNRPECLNRVTGALCVDESQVWLSAARQGWVFGGDAAYVHYCSVECRAADAKAKAA